MKDIFSMGKFLFITCAIAAICLAYTEQITKPHILRQAAEKKAKARKAVLPDANKFLKQDITILEKQGSEETATHPIGIGLDESGKYIGMVKEVYPKGFGGPIEIVLGLTPEMVISGVEITKMTETPGLGTKLKEDFLRNFLNLCKQKGNKIKVKLKKDGGDVDGITAATVSSRAFCKGVSEGWVFVSNHLEEIKEKAAKEAEKDLLQTEKSTLASETTPTTSPLGISSLTTTFEKRGDL